MPIRFPVSPVTAEVWAPSQRERRSNPSRDVDTVLYNLPTTHAPERVLASSVDGTREVITKKNGFVLGVVQAYNKHHNLVIRPDDVWIAIISQLNFYINAHAEELRDKFVDHTGKKTLVVTSDAPSLDKVDFGDLTVQLTAQINNNVKDKSLIPWVLPNFTTTTVTDKVICSALIMSTLKQYFHYVMRLGCGIPYITLEGTQADWQDILDRIDKIPEFGDEPAEWAPMLRVILKRFVRAFDVDGPVNDKEFWERMVHESPGGSFVPYISGWVSAFCAWDTKGTFFAAKKSQEGFGRGPPQWVINLKFDGVWFPRVNTAPEGYAEVDVIVNNQWEGKEYDCTLLAGHVAIEMTEEGGKLDTGKLDTGKLDTVKIAPQWFLYVKGEERTAGRGFW